MPTNNPVAEPTTAAAANKPRLMIDGDRRTLGRSAGPTVVAETGQLDEDSDEEGDGEVAPRKPSRVADSDVLPDSCTGGTVGPGMVGS